MLDDDLLTAAIAKRDAARKKVATCKSAFEDAEDELRLADEAVHVIAELKREHNDFNADAARFLSS